MSSPTAANVATNLFLLDELQDSGRTSDLAEHELSALRAISEWIESYVTKPSEDIGRPGTVCPFVPGSLERRVLWLAPELIADRNATEVVELMNGYKGWLLENRPTKGEDVIYDVIAVVFSDLPPARAEGVFANVQSELGLSSYAEDGILFGPYYEGNEATALYNPSFRPFESPVPFMFVRHGVIGDWKFFLKDDDWLDLWARRFGVSAVRVLAEELRRLPWNTPQG